MQKKTVIKSAGFTTEELRGIAALHRKSISGGFLADANVGLLELLYSYIAQEPSCVLVGAFIDGRTSGFVSGTLNTKKFFMGFVKRHLFRAGLMLAPRFVSPSFFKKVFEILQYPFKISKTNEVNAELLSMAVAEEFQGQGIAQPMFEAFVHELKDHGGTSFKIIAGCGLGRANSFYKKMGAKTINTVEVHGGAKSQVYIYNV